MKKTTSSLLISKIRFPLIKRQRWEGESSDVTGVPPHPHPHPAHLSGLGGGGGKAVCRETGRRFGGVVGLILQYNHAACLGRLAKRFIRKPRGGGGFLPATHSMHIAVSGLQKLRASWGSAGLVLLCHRSLRNAGGVAAGQRGGGEKMRRCSALPWGDVHK